MFKKILVLLMMGTLPMFAFSHAVGNGGYGNLDSVIMYFVGFSLLILIQGLSYMKYKKDQQLIKIISIFIVMMILCVFIVPISIVYTLPLLDMIMTLYLAINLLIDVFKKLF